MSTNDAVLAAAGARTGTLRGDFAVASDGAALYTIPLTVPPGTAGHAPTLGLAYSSAAGNDLLGVGWRLTGLSAITRVGATLAQDGFRGGVSYSARDRFALDGQRLVTVQGSYGAAGSIYHTEIESWKKVVPTHGTTAGRDGPDSFTVHEKNGNVIEFGNTADSRIVASASNPSVRSWLVNRITDRNGNFITFKYTTAEGNARIERIDYTGHRNVAPRRSVRFEYEARPDATLHYVAGFPVSTTHRMTRIDTYVDETRVTRYQLAYHAPGVTNRSRLASITQIDAAGNQLNPTRIEWQDGDARLLSAKTAVSPTALPFGGSFLPVDVNGDGRIDFLNAYPSNDDLVMDLYVARTNGAGFDGPQRVQPTTPPLPWGGHIIPMDVNGDGHTDIVYAWRDNDTLRFTVFLATQEVSGNWVLKAVKASAGDLTLPWGGELHAADVDGDGATDLIHVVETDNGTDFTIIRSNRSGFVRGRTTHTSLPAGGIGMPLDVNADGMTDLAYAYHRDDRLKLAVLESNGEQLTVRESVLPAALNLEFSGALLPMDMNGDGLTDLVHAGQNGSGNLVLTPIMSTGAGFLAHPAQTFDGVPFNALLLPGELNGDGLADLVVAVKSPEGTKLHTLLSSGTQFRVVQPNQPLLSTEAGSLMPLDLNGVGRSGLLNLADANGKLTLGSVLPSGEAPDLVSKVTTGGGATYAVKYRPITDADVYRHTSASVTPNGMLGLGGTAIGATFTPSADSILPGSTGAAAPTMTAAFPKYVISSYIKSDGRGNAYEYKYQYDNAAIDIATGRGWLGFQHQTATDVDAGTVTTTTFKQQFPLASTVEESAVKCVRDSSLMYRTVMKYDVVRPTTVTYQALSTDTTTQLYTFGKLDATQQSTTRYDSYGNAILSSELGDGSGAPLFTHRTYHNDATAWRIGFATSELKSADVDGKVILASKKFELAPNTMNVVVQSVWHDQANAWLDSKSTHDVFGNVLTETDHAGARRSSTYDAFNTFVATETTPPNADGATYVTTYEHEAAFGEIIRVVDGNNVQTRQRIDGFGRIAAKLGPSPKGGEVELHGTEWGEDANGVYQEDRDRLDWEGTQWIRRREYVDGLERVHRTVSYASDGVTPVTVEKKYNSRNLVTYETLPWKQGETALSIKHTFDEYDRTTRTERPSGDGGTRVDVFKYPDVHTMELTAGAGSASERKTKSVQGSYNGKQLPKTLTDATGHVSTIAYDALGRTTRTTDPVGNVTSITYDTLDNKTSAKVTNGENTTRAETATYDMVARKVTKRDARGRSTVMTLDALGRPVSESAEGKATTFKYDQVELNSVGRVSAVTMDGGAAYAFAYDAYGNQSRITVTAGGEAHKFERSFLPANRPEKTVYPDGAVHRAKYTPGGMLDSHNGSDGAGGGAVSIGFGDFNASGKPGALRYGNGFRETLTYNVAKQLKSQAIADAKQTAVLNTVFNWNTVDDLVAIEDRLAAARSYGFTYDKAGRLVKATGPYTKPQEFAYDGGGNLTQKDGVPLRYTKGQLVGAGSLALEYDSSGNTTRITGDGKERALEYNAHGKLVSGSGCTFTYDHQGRRLSKRQPNGTVTWYVASDYEVVVRADGSRQHTRSLRTPFGLAATVTTVDKGTAADPAKEPGIPAPGVCYFHRNQVNSTTIVSDGAGAVVANVEYLPFGEVSSIRGTEAFRPKFAGRELDHETGLYDFGARYYLPQIGRFITADDGLGGPMDRHDAMNSYAYVLNSPVCNVDPTGRSIFDKLAAPFIAMGNMWAKVGTWIGNNTKEWMPYVISGLMVVGGIAILATTPFGGPASAMLGGMLLGAGISGIVYAATHTGDDFKWSSFGIQLGVGGAIGLVSGGLSFGASAASNALFAGGRAAFALGATGRVALQAAAGMIDGAAGGAFGTYVTNLDNGRDGAQGVGWAALIGGIAGGIGAGVGSKLAGSSRLSRAPNMFEHMDRLDRYGFNPVVNARISTASGVIGQAVLRAPAVLFSGGGKAILNFGPQPGW